MSWQSKLRPRSPFRLSPRKAVGFFVILALTVWLFTQKLPMLSATATAPRIAIVTFITSQPSYMHQSLKNKWFYSRKHGYNLILDYAEHSDRGTMWLKFDMIERLIRANKHDWIWWIDFDTLFTNLDIPITDIIQEALTNSTHPESLDFILSRDCNDFNAGSLITRSSPRALAFLNRVRAYRDAEASHGSNDDTGPLHEQEAMKRLLHSNPAGEMPHVFFVPQTRINAFPEEIHCYDKEQRAWEEGMLMVHFAGAWAYVKKEDPTGYLMRLYEPYSTWVYEQQLPNPAMP